MRNEKCNRNSATTHIIFGHWIGPCENKLDAIFISNNVRASTEHFRRVANYFQLRAALKKR